MAESRLRVLSIAPQSFCAQLCRSTWNRYLESLPSVPTPVQGSNDHNPTKNGASIVHIHVVHGQYCGKRHPEYSENNVADRTYIHIRAEST